MLHTKACAALSETDRFITVDGDNRIREDFLNQVIDFEEHTDLQNTVISWCGRNEINGLMYGNGGLKCWPKIRIKYAHTRSSRS